MLRPLGNFERALRLSDLYAPFNIVIVVLLESPPKAEAIQRALGTLQIRHPFLRSRVEMRDGRPCFMGMENFSVPFEVLEDQAEWLTVVEDELGRGLDSLLGPLFRCTYLNHGTHAELVLTLQHTVVDATSAAHLLHELLSIAIDPLIELRTLEPAPPVESRFPPSHRGLGRYMRILNYAIRQMADEVRYQFAMHGRGRALIHFGARPRVLTMTLDAPLTEALSRRARQEKVTLNSLLQAAMMLSVCRCRYERRPVPIRTFTFPDLRAYVSPPLDPEHLGAYISMLRYTFIVSGDQSIWELARNVNVTMQQSFQRGEKFVASLMSAGLIKLMLGLKSMRMGTSALSYTGVSTVLNRYGDTHVLSLHGFVSNLDLGPEFSSQVSLFDDTLIWDMMYMDRDMSQAEAQHIGATIRQVLEESLR